MLLAISRSFASAIAATVLLCAANPIGCSRTNLRDVKDNEQAPTVCLVDDDCRGDDACKLRVCSYGLCQIARIITCDDGNPCTRDTCNQRDASCENTWLSADEDGDGYRAALPGKRPGDADACGDDCNDASALAYPGAKERCDGVDNDCNGTIDDGYHYYGPDEGLPRAIPVATGTNDGATPAGMSYDGQKFGMTLVEQHDRLRGMFYALSTSGEILVPAQPLTLAANDSVAGPLIWTGAFYGTAWEDRREISYDIYFNRLDSFGKKLHPDVRITQSDGFSVQPSLMFDGTQWIVAYADDQATGRFAIYARRISMDAQPLGDAVQLTPDSMDARQPRLTKNSTGLGLFYYSTDLGRFEYVRVSSELAFLGERIPLQLAKDSDATIRWGGDRYLIAWDTKTKTSFGNAISAMTIDENGRTLDPPRSITHGASVARGPSIVALGGRFVLLWSDDRFSPDRFEVSMQTFSNNLVALDEQQPVTALGAYSLDPAGVLGGGTLGIVFRSRLTGPSQTYFIALGCWSPEPR